MFKLRLGLKSLNLIAIEELVTYSFSNYYPLSNNSLDVIGGINGADSADLTYQNSVFGTSPLFTGTEYINLGNNHDLGLTDKSYSIWIYPTILGGEQSIFAKSLAGATPNRFFLELLDSRIRFLVVDSNNVIRSIQSVSYFNLEINTAYKIDIVVDRINGDFKLYINGILNNTNPHNLGNQNITNNYDMEIGGYNDNTGKASNILPYYGFVSTFKIYPEALTDVEILDNYNQEKSQLGV